MHAQFAYELQGNAVSDDWTGAIDCDIHPRAPKPLELARYMDDVWRDTVEVRGIDGWEFIAYPANAPLTVRPDWRQVGAGHSRPRQAPPRPRSTASASRTRSATAFSRSRPSATRTWPPPSRGR